MKTGLSHSLNRIGISISKDGRSLALNLLILWMGEVAGKAAAALAFIHLARILQPSAYGQLELVLSSMLLLTVLVDLGLGPLGTREVSVRPEDSGRLVTQIAGAQLLASALAGLGMAVIAWRVPMEGVLNRLLLGYSLTILAFPFLLNWVFQGWNQMKWVALPQVARQFAFAGLIFLLVRRPEDILRTPGIELASAAVAVFLNLFLYRRSGGRFRLSLKEALDWRLITGSLPVAASQLIWAGRMYLPLIALGLLISTAASGFFAAPHRIIMVLQTLVTLYFNNLFPRLSQVSHQSQAGLVRLLHNSLRLTIWTTLALAVGVTLSARPLVGILFGAAYQQSATVPVMMILIWIIPVIAWRSHNWFTLLALNLQKKEMLASLAGVLVLAVIFYPLVAWLGAAGAALAMVASELAGAVITWQLLKRSLPGLQLVQPLFRLSLEPAE